MLGRRGEGGFAESVMALMAVIISLTLFMAALPHSFLHNEEEDIDTDILDRISIKDGDIALNIDTDTDTWMKSMGWTALNIDISVIGSDSKYTKNIGAGEGDPENVFGTFLLNSEDGRRMNAEYRLAVWI